MGGKSCPAQQQQTLVQVSPQNTVPYRIVYIHVAPASVETNTFEAPLLATPTKIRGVGEPDEPVVESKVTHAIPVNTRRMSYLVSFWVVS